MRNFKKGLIVKVVIILLAITVPLVVVHNIIEAKNIEIAKAKIAEIKANNMENKLNTYITQDRTKLILIQEKLNFARENTKSNKELFDEVKKRYESGVWYENCLEAQGELELKGVASDLLCEKYFDTDSGLTNDKAYIDLEQFASYNLDRTLYNLGL